MNKLTLQKEIVVLTGKFATAKHRDIQIMVEAAGATVRSQISRKTTLVVVGMLGWGFSEGKISNTLLRAEDLQQQGQHLAIISETALLQRLQGGTNNHSTHSNSAAIPLCRAANMLGVEPLQIRRWAQFGLLKLHGEQVDFQDLVSLRSIAGLINTGLDTQQLAHALGELQRMVPDLERPFAQARILQHSDNSVVLELKGSKMNTDGQFLLDFDAVSENTQRSPKTLKQPPPTPSAEDSSLQSRIWNLLQEGLSLEQQQQWSRAQVHYEQAIQLSASNIAIHSDNHLANLHFYLGNCLQAQQQYQQAVSQYQQAVELAPQHYEARYNLAYALEETGQVSAAVVQLKTLIKLKPDYADAHFNLARLLMRNNQGSESLTYWKTYLQYDQDSAWAKVARRHLLIQERS